MNFVDHDHDFFFFNFGRFAAAAVRTTAACTAVHVLVGAVARYLYHTQRLKLRTALTPVSGVSEGRSGSVCRRI